MVTIETKVKRVGGSVVLAILPRDAKELDLKVGQTVAIVVPPKRYSAFGAYRGLLGDPDSKEDRWDPDVDD